jgi:glutathione S-transferase
MTVPLLYTFRRCPYAIRARLAIAASGVTVREHEVKLSAKHAAMLAVSPKGTVPVLVLNDERVIEESLEIMQWALEQHDPMAWLNIAYNNAHDDAAALIAQNDDAFKYALDRYKYPERFPEFDAAHYRDVLAAPFLQAIEARLTTHAQLLGENTSYVDAAIFPFIRQFASVDLPWFAEAPYPALRRWLNEWLDSPLFVQVMEK